MPPDVQSTLEELMKLTRDNNSMLHKMRRGARNAQMMRGFYWLLIIGVSVAGYYTIKPYIEKVQSLYSDGQNAIENVKDFGSGLPKFGQ